MNSSSKLPNHMNLSDAKLSAIKKAVIIYYEKLWENNQFITDSLNVIHKLKECIENNQNGKTYLEIKKLNYENKNKHHFKGNEARYFSNYRKKPQHTY